MLQWKVFVEVVWLFAKMKGRPVHSVSSAGTSRAEGRRYLFPQHTINTEKCILQMVGWGLQEKVRQLKHTEHLASQHTILTFLFPMSVPSRYRTMLYRQ